MDAHAYRSCICCVRRQHTVYIQMRQLAFSNEQMQRRCGKVTLGPLLDIFFACQQLVLHNSSQAVRAPTTFKNLQPKRTVQHNDKQVGACA